MSRRFRQTRLAVSIDQRKPRFVTIGSVENRLDIEAARTNVIVALEACK
jgi:hypothetical protein